MSTRAAVGGATAVLLALAGAGAAQDLDPSIRLLESAAERYSRTSTLCADFDQLLEVTLLRDEKRGRGRLCQAQPNLFAMRFVEPDGDRVVVDGQWVWVYQPSVDDRTVLRRAIARGSGGYDFHREFLEDPALKYDPSYQGEELVGDRPAHRIRLVPKQPVSYRTAIVWLDRSSLALRKLRVEDENGSIRTVTLSAIETDVAVPAGFFEFRSPPGVQVITR